MSQVPTKRARKIVQPVSVPLTVQQHYELWRAEAKRGVTAPLTPEEDAYCRLVARIVLLFGTIIYARRPEVDLSAIRTDFQPEIVPTPAPCVQVTEPRCVERAADPLHGYDPRSLRQPNPSLRLYLVPAYVRPASAGRGSTSVDSAVVESPCAADICPGAIGPGISLGDGSC